MRPTVLDVEKVLLALEPRAAYQFPEFRPMVAIFAAGAVAAVREYAAQAEATARQAEILAEYLSEGVDLDDATI